MATKFALLILSCFLIASCNKESGSSTLEKNDIVNIVHNIDTLAIIAENKEIRLTKNDTIKLLKNILKNEISDSCTRLKAFFYLFPSTNQGYHRLYSNIENRDSIVYQSPFSEVCESHTSFFLQTQKCIDKDVFISKVINLGFNAKRWNSEMGFCLHASLIYPAIKSNAQITLKILKKKSETDIYAFWQFYFDYPYPESYFNIIDSNKIENISRIDPDFYLIVKRAYNNVLKDWK